jgi:hypothetical protein
MQCFDVVRESKGSLVNSVEEQLARALTDETRVVRLVKRSEMRMPKDKTLC